MKRAVFIFVFALYFAAPFAAAVAAKPSLIPTRRPTKANTPQIVTTGMVKRAENRRAVLMRMVSHNRKRADTYREFLTKTQTRIDTLSAEGKDVSKFTSYLATAKANLDEVDAAIVKLGNVFTALDVSGDRATVRNSVHTELQKVREAFTKLHTTMKQTVEKVVQTQAEIQPTKRPRPSGFMPVEKVINPGKGNRPN